MKVLLADKLAPEAIAALERLPGVSVDSQPQLGAGDLKEHLAGVEILVVRSTKVQKEALDTADRLGLIIRAGAGVNTIDVAYASEKGIYVANCPGKNAVAVAELAVGLLLALDRQIADGVADLRAGQWNKGKYSKARGIKGLTVGVIGTGSIGQAFLQRLRGFEVDLVAWSRSLTPEKAEAMGVGYAATLEDLASRCDVVSVHVALNDQTRGFLGEDFFSALKPGSVFLNTSRGEVVDNDALLKALERGVKVGSDVFAGEPGSKQAEFVSPVAQHPNCYGSHHIGASTAQSERDTGLEAARVAAAFVGGEPIPNCVNLRREPNDGHALVVRHEDRVGVLAGVFKKLKEAGVNVQEMENTVFEGAKAACARILVEQPPSEALVGALKSCDGVLHVRATGN